MKTTNAKKIYRTRVRRYRRKPAKKISTAVKTFVRKAISRNIENKCWYTYGANSSLITATPTTNPTHANLLPTNFLQGTGKSQRIGNEITIKKAYIRGRINLLPYNATTNPLSAPILVKMWVVSNKLSNTFIPTVASNWASFFDTVNSAVAFQNSPLDMILDVNKDAWTLHASKTFKLGAGSMTSTGPVGSSAYFDNSSMSVPFYFNYGKYIKKVKYDDALTNNPTNRNLYLVLQAVNADGTSTAQIPAETHFSTTVIYEDA